jgi:hypothetical protein
MDAIVLAGAFSGLHQKSLASKKTVLLCSQPSRINNLAPHNRTDFAKKQRKSRAKAAQIPHKNREESQQTCEIVLSSGRRGGAA